MKYYITCNKLDFDFRSMFSKLKVDYYLDDVHNIQTVGDVISAKNKKYNSDYHVYIICKKVSNFNVVAKMIESCYSDKKVIFAIMYDKSNNVSDNFLEDAMSMINLINIAERNGAIHVKFDDLINYINNGETDAMLQG